MPLRYLFVLCFLCFAACTTTEPLPDPAPEPEQPTPPATPDTTTSPAPPPEDAPEPDPIEPTPDEEPEPDPLYEQTEDALRVAFTDGLFGLYRAEADPTEARRLDRTEIQAWLTDLALVSPRAVEFARAQLGPVLDQAHVVGLLLEDAAEAECASVRDVLYVPVPARFQSPDRPFTGYLIQDTCGVASDELAPFCTGGFGTTEGGASCSCLCTTGEAPGVPCVSC